MRAILVPTDFSNLSKIGLSNAIGLAKKTGSKVIVISVVTELTADTRQLSNVKKFQASMLAARQADGEKLLAEFKSIAGKVEISFQPVAGYPVVDVIEKFAVKNKVGLIVMSSKGATGLKKVLVGSNAAAVIDNSSIPVLLIPSDAKARTIRKVVYATDAKDFRKQARVVGVFAEALGASMDVVHVVPEDEDKQTDPLGLSAQKIRVIAAYPKIRFHLLYNKDVSKGLELFIKGQKDDFILITFTHKLSFNEKLFGKSVTQRLAYLNKVPLLVVNKTNYKGF